MMSAKAIPAHMVRTYHTAAFAALAGVTPRALRHYDRLGLLKPRRSAGGYRLYSDDDLQTLEEIAALKFIGVPLKEIAAIRQRAKQPFALVLQAQRETLEARRRAMTRAIDAIAAAQTSLRAGAAVDSQLVAPLIEAMHMDRHHEEVVATYTRMLKAKASRLASMPAGERATLNAQWMALIADVRSALREDPAGPRAQVLLDRWIALLRGFADPRQAEHQNVPTDLAFTDTAALREEVWARRAEWLPAATAEEAACIPSADEALAHLRAQAESFQGSDVMEFIRQARAARADRPPQRG